MTSILNVNIITPVSRLVNLPIIYQSLERAKTDDVNLSWYIIVDANEDRGCNNFSGTIPVHDYFITREGNGLSGNPQRNLGLDKVSDGYVYFLDDDNICHPDLFFRLNLSETYDTIYFFNQVFKNGNIRLKASKGALEKGPGHVDTAQVILPRSFIGDIRWDNWDYCADGVFFSKIFNQHTNVEIVDKNLCYYNYLR